MEGERALKRAEGQLASLLDNIQRIPPGDTQTLSRKP